MSKWDALVNPEPPLSIWICIPELPPSLNVWSRKHWRVRHALVEEMTNNLRLLAMAYKIPRIEKAEVRLVYFFRDNRRRDPDNYAPKFLLDGLRKSGIIAEDNFKVLRLPQPEFKVDGKNPRTEVWITEWED
ncbi:MAG: hypothetical protein P4L49_02720 [Desulfosporosinus sp.]|nr:hypothetical protein [Desulfosporosinus sp.]